MIHTVHKIFNGLVDIPDYKVQEHIKRKKTLRVVWGKQFMDLPPEALKKPEAKSELFRSKFYPDQTYRLYSYKWKPQKEAEIENIYTIKYQYKN